MAKCCAPLWAWEGVDRPFGSLGFALEALYNQHERSAMGRKVWQEQAAFDRCASAEQSAGPTTQPRSKSNELHRCDGLGASSKVHAKRTVQLQCGHQSVLPPGMLAKRARKDDQVGGWNEAEWVVDELSTPKC